MNGNNISGGNHTKRLGTASIGMLLANFIVALLVFQFGMAIHPNVAATGALLFAFIVNFLVSKYFS